VNYASAAIAFESALLFNCKLTLVIALLMPREKDYIPTDVRRIVAFYSFGRCQYRNCDVRVVAIEPNRASFEHGHFAHILPVGDGPRAGWKDKFPGIDLNSSENIMLLCPNHHDLIDRTQTGKHPPHLLFRMKSEKAVLLSEAISEAISTMPGVSIDDYQREYEAYSILDKLWQARIAGPRRGYAVFKAAEAIVNNLIQNPFFKGEPVAVLLRCQLHATELLLSYRRSAWAKAFSYCKNLLGHDLPSWLMAQVLSLALALVRDDFGMFANSEKATLIALGMKKIESLIDIKSNPRASAQLLITKSSLLRWRARLEVGNVQRNTLGEAERCATKSRSLGAGAPSLLQIALVNYSLAMTIAYRDAPRQEVFLNRCFEALEAEELAEFPAAINYRPRVYRDVYRYADSIDAFHFAAERQVFECYRSSYLLGEASLGKFNFTENADIECVSDALSFIAAAIEAGYSHGRNMLAYIGCRAVVEPDWFRNAILDTLLQSSDLEIEWVNVLKYVRQLFSDIQDPNGEETFGVDEGEFWNTLGSIAGYVLGEHTIAIRFLGIADKHAQLTGGRFRALVMLAQESLSIGNRAEYRRYLDAAKARARAHQIQIISQLEKNGKKG